MKAAQDAYEFIVEENSVETWMCFDFEDDAKEHPGNFLDLKIRASVGKITVLDKYRHFFVSECETTKLRTYTQTRRVELVEFPACRISTVPHANPPYEVIKEVLSNLLYTAPGRYHGEVSISIEVEDIGFTGGINSGYGERGLRIDLGR